MKKALTFVFILFFYTQVMSENVYHCSGQATMCVRKINNVWIADICDSSKFIFRFNDSFTELTYKKKVRDNNGNMHNITERLKCRMVDSVSSKRNKELLSASNGRTTCIDFDGSQLGIPEVLDEVIHFSKNNERFSIYPMHSHSFLMDGPQTDFVTFGTCKKFD